MIKILYICFEIRKYKPVFNSKMTEPKANYHPHPHTPPHHTTPAHRPTGPPHRSPPDLLEYTAASRFSQMKGQALTRYQGVTFGAINTRLPIVVDVPHTYGDLSPPPAVDVRVDVQYGRRWYPATIVRDRGRGCFDVHYDTGEKEAGVPLSRLRSHTKVIPVVHTFDGIEPNGWPFVCVPLLVGKDGEAVVGVLAIDTFDEMPKSHELIRSIEYTGRWGGGEVGRCVCGGGGYRMHEDQHRGFVTRH